MDLKEPPMYMQKDLNLLAKFCFDFDLDVSAYNIYFFVQKMKSKNKYKPK